MWQNPMENSTNSTVLCTKYDKYLVLQLNRPRVLNALNEEVMETLSAHLARANYDDAVHSVVLTGHDKAFAAGADIHMMKDLSFPDTYKQDFITRNWDAIASFRKPIIAAVNGFALGGGCELALNCDIVIAGECARFGQPEVTVGVIPGAGGTQRLARSIGKAKTMDLCLTARTIDAHEAERIGIVSRIVPSTQTVQEACRIAKQLATLPLVSILMIKESILQAFETPLSQGIKLERRLFQACFALHDQKEGMSAFTDKRPALFTDQ